MQTKPSAPLNAEQKETLSAMKSLLDTAQESIQQMQRLSKTMPDDPIKLVFLCDLPNLTEDGFYSQENFTHLGAISATPQELEAMLAHEASEQSTPWMIHCYRRAASMGNEHKLWRQRKRGKIKHPGGLRSRILRGKL